MGSVAIVILLFHLSGLLVEMNAVKCPVASCLTKSRFASALLGQSCLLNQRKETCEGAKCIEVNLLISPDQLVDTDWLIWSFSTCEGEIIKATITSTSAEVLPLKPNATTAISTGNTLAQSATDNFGNNSSTPKAISARTMVKSSTATTAPSTTTTTPSMTTTAPPTTTTLLTTTTAPATTTRPSATPYRPTTTTTPSTATTAPATDTTPLTASTTPSTTTTAPATNTTPLTTTTTPPKTTTPSATPTTPTITITPLTTTTAPTTTTLLTTTTAPATNTTPLTATTMPSTATNKRKKRAVPYALSALNTVRPKLEPMQINLEPSCNGTATNVTLSMPYNGTYRNITAVQRVVGCCSEPECRPKPSAASIESSLRTCKYKVNNQFNESLNVYCLDNCWTSYIKFESGNETIQQGCFTDAVSGISFYSSGPRLDCTGKYKNGWDSVNVHNTTVGLRCCQNDMCNDWKGKDAYQYGGASHSTATFSVFAAAVLAALSFRTDL